MKKILISVLFPICIYGQPVQKINSLGFGFSNNLETLTSLFNNSNAKQLLHIDYKNKSDSSKNFRSSLFFNLPKTENNVMTIDNLFIAIGYGKQINFLKMEKLNIYYGIDFYYKMTAKRARLGPIISSSNYGFGVLGFLEFEFAIDNNLSLYSEFNMGIGFHQNEDGPDPGTGLITWYLKKISTKNLSIGIRKSF